MAQAEPLYRLTVRIYFSHFANNQPGPASMPIGSSMMRTAPCTDLEIVPAFILRAPRNIRHSREPQDVLGCTMQPRNNADWTLLYILAGCVLNGSAIAVIDLKRL